MVVFISVLTIDFKKVGEEMKANVNLIKEIEEFDNAFADGIFAVPRNPNDKGKG